MALLTAGIALLTLSGGGQAFACGTVTPTATRTSTSTPTLTVHVHSDVCIDEHADEYADTDEHADAHAHVYEHADSHCDVYVHPHVDDYFVGDRHLDQHDHVNADLHGDGDIDGDERADEYEHAGAHKHRRAHAGRSSGDAAKWRRRSGRHASEHRGRQFSRWLPRVVDRDPDRGGGAHRDRWLGRAPQANPIALHKRNCRREAANKVASLLVSPEHS